MEQMNLQITQTAQPTFTVEVVQNLVPVISAQVVIGGNSGGTAKIEFGDTMTGTGTPADPVNVSNDILDQINYNTQATQDNASQIEEIQDLIPATANAQNQLADQGFVNSSIQTATAYFRGDWATWADVPSDPSLYPVDATGNRTPTTNDYMVVITDEQTNGGTWRYKYTGVWAEQGKDGWQAEYQVNETPLTAAQLAALNSGVTAQAVADIAANKNAIAGKQNKLTAGTGITIEGNTISADGAGGDFLPLSGGTLTGATQFNIESSTSFVRVPLLSVVDKNGSVLPILKSFYSINGLSANLYMPLLTIETDLYVNRTAYIKTINNGADIAIPTSGGTLARLEDLAGLGGGASLPDQTGNAGKFLTTDGTDVSWGGENLVQDNATFKGNGLAVGTRAAATASGSTAYGTNSSANGQNATAIGVRTEATSFGVAIGSDAKSKAVRAIQLGYGTNSDANTFKVGNENGNFDMMDANGNVPLGRLTYVTQQIGDISTALTAILGE